MLLKRNGETCEHSVPGFPGLLTDSEKKAYTEAFASVEWLLKEFNEGATALAEIERQIPKLAKEASENTTDKAVTIRGAESEWLVHRTLHKSARNELLLCSRQTEQGTQFGVVEQFAHNSVYAEAHGNTELQMTSNQAALLLQDYVERERHVLQFFRQDIEASVEETLAEKFPGQDHSRVVKAISARCGKQISPSNGHSPSEKQAKNVRIRF
jgi:hypothetical protein